MVTSTLTDRMGGFGVVGNVDPVPDIHSSLVPDGRDTTAETLGASPIDENFDPDSKEMIVPNHSEHLNAVAEDMADTSLQHSAALTSRMVGIPEFGFEGRAWDVLESRDHNATLNKVARSEVLSGQVDLFSRLSNHPQTLSMVPRADSREKGLHNNPWTKFIEATSDRTHLMRTCDSFCRCSCHAPKTSWDWSVTRFQKVLGSVQYP
jgi:hypothetical protein